MQIGRIITENLKKPSDIVAESENSNILPFRPRCFQDTFPSSQLKTKTEPTSAGAQQVGEVWLTGSDETVDEAVEVGDTSTSQNVQQSLSDGDVRMTGRRSRLHVLPLLLCTSISTPTW